MFDTVKILVRGVIPKEKLGRLSGVNGWEHKITKLPRPDGSVVETTTIFKNVLSEDLRYAGVKGRNGHKPLSVCRLIYNKEGSMTIESSLPKVEWATNALVLYNADHALERLREVASREFGVDVGDLKLAQLMRVDYSTLFTMERGGPTPREVINSLAAVEVPGKNTQWIHGPEGDTVAIHGKATKLTIYDKLAEVRLSQPWAVLDAQGKVRLEVQMRRRQVKTLAGHKQPTVGEMLFPEYAIHALHREIEMIGLRKQEVVARDAVMRTLKDRYGEETGWRLASFIAAVAQYGKDAVKAEGSPRTFRRNMKMLRDVGVAPISSAVALASLSLAIGPGPLDERERTNLMWAMADSESGESTGSKERTFEDARERWNTLVQESLALTGQLARRRVPATVSLKMRGIADRFAEAARIEAELDGGEVVSGIFDDYEDDIELVADRLDLGTNTEAQETANERLAA